MSWKMISELVSKDYGPYINALLSTGQSITPERHPTESVVSNFPYHGPELPLYRLAWYITFN